MDGCRGGGGFWTGMARERIATEVQYNLIHTIQKLLFAHTARQHKFSAITIQSRMCPGWHKSCFYCVTYLSQRRGKYYNRQSILPSVEPAR